jgi:hypothetical protein
VFKKMCPHDRAHPGTTLKILFCLLGWKTTENGVFVPAGQFMGSQFGGVCIYVTA